MNPVEPHPWNLTPREAVRLQKELAQQVIRRGAAPREPLLVAGCDAAGRGRWARRDEEIIAGVLVLRIPGWELVDAAWARGPSPFPYIPGLLSFREAPLYLKAFHKLRLRPDILLCDGQGIAHPRGLGLASHLGLLLDLPTVGVAKSRLVGEHREPGRRRGCATRLLLDGHVVGRVLRTQDGVRPLYISPGHKIGVAEAVSLVLRLAPRYRLPEPTRLADIWVTQLRTEERSPPPQPRIG